MQNSMFLSCFFVPLSFVHDFEINKWTLLTRQYYACRAVHADAGAMKTQV